VKVFISVDMEGISGVSCWDDVDPGKPSYARFRRVMTAEVNAAVDGALQAQAAAVLVNDSHGGMRNVLIEELNYRAELISGWPKPLGMMTGVDSGVDVAFLIGCHARAGTPHAIMDHTWSGSRVYRLTVNGQELGEVGLNAALAGHFGVPVALVAGDRAVTEEARALLGPNLVTCAVKEALSRESVRCLPPERAHGMLRAAALRALRESPPAPLVIESPVTISVDFVNSLQAEAAGSLPGARRTGGRTVEWTGEDVIAAFHGMVAMLALS
jgi:D-amino peptidase